MTDEPREHRSDETEEQRSVREWTEGHVKGVEQAADKGLLSRRQAERVTKAGQKATGSHDLARGVGRMWRGDNEVLCR